MTVQELYDEALERKFVSLYMTIEWLVFEKQVLTMERDARNIEFILKKYGDQLNPHIGDYIRRNTE